MDEKYNALFTPWKIGNVEIPNRIVQCSMGGTSLFGWLEPNHFDKEAAYFLLNRAQDGVGLILPGMQCVRDTMGIPGRKWLWQNDRMFKELKPNLSSHKPGWDARWEEFSDWADKGQKLMTELLHLVDEDTEAFNRIMNVFSMPKGTDEEKAARSAALQEATLYATQVPLRTMQTSFKVFEIVKAMAEQGNPNSVTDAGVGALAARSAVLGACLNVKINAAGLKDRAVADDLIGQANRIVADAEKAEREILEIVESKIK